MKLEKISASHLKNISKLKIKKYRNILNEYLIESEKFLIEALTSNAPIIELYIVENKIEKLIAKYKEVKDFDGKVYILKESDFKKISNEKTPSGVGALVKKINYTLEDLTETDVSNILFLYEIADPGNLGTIIRTADWFGFKNIILSTNTVELTNPKVIKASMGSIFHLRIVEETEASYALDYLRRKNFRIYSTSTKGKDLTTIEINKRFVLIFGNESKGIPQWMLDFSDEIISIPPKGKAESLNVAISSAIILYEISKKII